jgi:hypothetical protein
MSETSTVFRIAWEYQGQTTEVSAVVNPDNTITLTLPDGQSATVDVPTSRAVQMLLNHITYMVLDPHGPPGFDVQAQGPHGGWHSVYGRIGERG